MSEPRVEASSSALFTETIRFEWDDDRPRKMTETGYRHSLREVVAEVSSVTLVYTFTGEPGRDGQAPDWRSSVKAKGSFILKSGKPGEPRDLVRSYWGAPGELGEWLRDLAAQHHPRWEPIVERRPF